MPKRIILLFTALCFLTSYAFAQTCVADFFSVNYTATQGYNIVKTLTNNSKETILVGNVFEDQLTSGYIAKLSPQGTVLWSKKLRTPKYTGLNFGDAVALKDRSFIVIGSAFAIDRVNSFLSDRWGVIFRIDKFGNTMWTKSFGNYEPLSNFTYLTSIIQPTDNEFILFGNIGTRPERNIIGRGPQILIRMDANGNVSWRTKITSDQSFVLETFKIGSALINGGTKVVMAFRMEQAEQAGYGYGKSLQEGYYIVSVDYATGKKAWDKAYVYPSAVDYDRTSRGPVQHIAILPNGDLSFLFSFSTGQRYRAAPETQRSANMITDASGNLKKVTGYRNTIDGCLTVEALDAGNGSQVVLMYDGSKPLLMQIDKDGRIEWQKAYQIPGGDYTPVSLHAAGIGFTIISNEKLFQQFNLIKTDRDGVVDCLETAVNMIADDVTTLFKPVTTDFIFATGEEYFLPVTVIGSSFNVQANVICYNACCKDTVNLLDTKRATICSGKTFTLPGNEIVRDSGKYYVTYKTARGCDSIVFYEIDVVKNPDSMKLQGAFCFEGKDTVQLTATPGFTSYKWNGINSALPYFNATRPGLYTVTVENLCGRKTDSIRIYEKCEFDIVMPNAFSPNGDRNNDVFRVPVYNKNLFVKLTVYNRFGQAIFESMDIAKGWDGRLRNQMQPTGTYAYVLVMKSFDGKILRHNGVVRLLR